jgi:hypothetical protein
MRASLFAFCVLCLAAAAVANAKDVRMVLDGLDGDVTTNEYNSYIAAINNFPPPPSNNIDTVMVYERLGGARLHGLQTFFSFTHDRRALDVAIVWSDGFLHARNDPTNGRIVWTGKRELCWPNKDPNDEKQALYSGAENGDVIEHIVNTAKLILENPSLWSQEAPPDKYNFGKTYLDRAKTYVNECQRSAETTIVPWYVHTTKQGYRLIHPDSKVYFKNCESAGPVPWNQQQFIVGGLLRLAQCHRLLNDGNTNIAYYEKITGDAADWFFSTAKLVNVKGKNCYDWGYVLVKDPKEHREDTGHSYYDVYVLRAYQANLGPTRVQMQRLINTALFAMNLGSNRFSGYVNGEVSQWRPEREYLNYQWIEMSVLDRRLYELTGNAVLATREYLFNDSVEAAMLYAKHYWATAPPSAAAEALAVVDNEVVDIEKGVSTTQRSKSSWSRLPLAARLSMIWVASEILLSLARRFKSNAVPRNRRSLGFFLLSLIALPFAILTAYRLPFFTMPLSDFVLNLAVGLFGIGLALRYAVLNPGCSFPTKAATTDHQVVDSSYPAALYSSYAGGFLALLGWGMTFQNWISLLILLASGCVAIFSKFIFKTKTSR